jgi:hypothetical protein
MESLSKRRSEMTAKIEAIGDFNAMPDDDPETALISAISILLDYVRATGGEAVAEAYDDANKRGCFSYV